MIDYARLMVLSAQSCARLRANALHAINLHCWAVMCPAGMREPALLCLLPLQRPVHASCALLMLHA